MSLIKSISGIRGTLGGSPKNSMHPETIVRFTLAYAKFIRQQFPDIQHPHILIGRDGRISGKFIQQLVEGALLSYGMNISELDYTTTPTMEVAIASYRAQGGIMITASHNPPNWNALKFFNHLGEFLAPSDVKQIIFLSESTTEIPFQENQLGQLNTASSFIPEHINKILSLPFVDVEAIRKRRFKVVADAINSTGAIALPLLFDALGVEAVIINDQPLGTFAHEPEPIPENLLSLSQHVRDKGADMGVAVDPDVDRLVLILPDGTPMGEEYTVVTAADYVLYHKRGNTVSNYSTTKALQDITIKHGGKHFQSPVGEIHVVQKMKEVQAIIGGEGNGGVIFPELHYGRDALVGIALILSGLAQRKISLLDWKNELPYYYMQKVKIPISSSTEIKNLLIQIENNFSPEIFETFKDDGLKLVFKDSWIHVRSSNTEPILRIIAESPSYEKTHELIEKVKRML